MSKTLILMRHAQASNDAARDIDRPLTAMGQAQAKSVGLSLGKQGVVPQHILHSPALRTTTTANLVMQAFNHPPVIETVKSFYSAQPEDVIEHVHACDQATQTLMLVGHNPWAHMLALLLSQTQSLMDYSTIKFSFPPSSCVVFDFAGDDWRSVQKGRGVIKNYFVGQEK